MAVSEHWVKVDEIFERMDKSEECGYDLTNLNYKPKIVYIFKNSIKQNKILVKKRKIKILLKLTGKYRRIGCTHI